MNLALSFKFILKTGVSGPSALDCDSKNRGSLICGGGHFHFWGFEPWISGAM